MAQLRRYREREMAKFREAEARNESLNRMLKDQIIIGGHTKSDKRVDMKRWKREQEEMARERAADAEYLAKATHVETKKTMMAMEQAAADELEARKARAVREDQLRRRICEESDELRQLKDRIEQAKVNRERAVQLLDMEYRTQEQRREEELLETQLEMERLRDLEEEKLKELTVHERMQHAKSLQQRQIAEKEQQRDIAMLEHEREKARVDAVVKRIQQEELEAMEKRRQQQAETQKQLKEFAEDAARLRKERQDADRAEEARIEAYARAKREMEERLEAEKAAKEREKKRILERMMAEQEAKASKDAELEYYRNELFWEELEKKNREREKAEAERRAKAREEMLAAYEYQMELKEKRRQEEEAQEAKFREELMAKFAKDARIEQMNDQKRRMKVLEHRREVDRLVEERKKRFEAEREKERKEHEELLKFDVVRKEVIAEERRRLLAEYGAELFEFLPRGTVKSEEERALCGR